MLGSTMQNRAKLYAIAPTPERSQHGQKIVPFTATETAGVYASRVVGECLLDVLLAKGHLGKYRQGDDRDSASQDTMRRYYAGIWLRWQFFNAGLGRASASGWGRQPSKGYDMSEGADFALRQYRWALSSLGPRKGHIVAEVCCYDRWPRFTRRDIHKALDLLAALPIVEA